MLYACEAHRTLRSDDAIRISARAGLAVLLLLLRWKYQPRSSSSGKEKTKNKHTLSLGEPAVKSVRRRADSA